MSLRVREKQETRNAVKVMAWIEHLAQHRDLPIDLDLLCHINKLILQDTDQHLWAGRVRSEVDWQFPSEWSRPRAIITSDDELGLAVLNEQTGKILVKFPPDREVGALLTSLLNWVTSTQATSLHPVNRAAIFHHRFTSIHPFRDGNGRTARALTILLLWRANFPIEILALQSVLDEQRNTYIDALRNADQGRLNDWILFFSQAVQQALKRQRSN